MRQLVRPLIQIAVADLLLAIHQGDPTRSARRLLCKQLVHATILGILPRARIPLHQLPLPVRLANQRQLRDRHRRICAHRLQHLLVTLHQPLDRRRLEQVRRVLESQRPH